MEDCIFCQIGAKNVPATVVYENDTVIAIQDLNPQAPVHVLVMPKAHYANLIDNVPEATLGALVEAVDEVAQSTGLADDGFRVVTNTGAHAGQTVNHLHLHVLGGKPLGEGLIP